MIKKYLILVLLVSSFPLHAETGDLERIAAGFKPTSSEIEAGAVVLKSEVNYEIKNDGRFTRNEHVVIAILDDRAVSDYAEISEGFNSYFNDSKLVSARLIDSNKKIHTVEPDAIQIKTKSTTRAYNDIKYISFSFKGLEKNSIFEYYIETVSKQPVIHGQWYADIYLVVGQLSDNSYRVDPIRESVINIQIPAEKELVFDLKNIDIKPEKQNKNGFKTYRWEAFNLPAVKTEEYIESYDQVYPLLRVSTVSSWKLIDEWGEKAYLESFPLDTEIVKVAESVTAGKKSRLEIVKAIYSYMMDNIRYISADFMRGGLIPHAPGAVLENKYGDCKDQSILFIKLLKAKGIQAYPALTGVIPELDADTKVPGLNFSHMISYVPDIDGGIWIDTSGDISTFPGINWILEDQSAFIINGTGGEIKKIGRNSYITNNINVDVNYDFLTDANTVNAKLVFSINGYLGETYKYISRFSEDPRKNIREMVTSLYPTATIKNIIINENIGVNVPFKASIDLSFGDVWASDDKSRFSYVGNMKNYLDMFWGMQKMPLPSEDRKSNYYIGYEFTLNTTETYNSPGKEYVASIISQNKSISNDFFEYEHKLTNLNTKVISHAAFTLKNRYINRDNYNEFYNKYREMANSSAWQVVYVMDKINNEKKLLTEQIDTNETTQNLLKLAINRIDAADYQSSKNILLQIIQNEPDNGEAYYYLGVTEGFLGNADASQDAFNKAEKNGYVP